MRSGLRRPNPITQPEPESPLLTGDPVDTTAELVDATAEHIDMEETEEERANRLRAENALRNNGNNGVPLNQGDNRNNNGNNGNNPPPQPLPPRTLRDYHTPRAGDVSGLIVVPAVVGDPPNFGSGW